MAGFGGELRERNCTHVPFLLRNRTQSNHRSCFHSGTLTLILKRQKEAKETKTEERILFMCLQTHVTYCPFPLSIAAVLSKGTSRSSLMSMPIVSSVAVKYERLSLFPGDRLWTIHTHDPYSLGS